MSALARKYSIEVLKKISFELGNFIKTACDVSGESGRVGTKESLGDKVEELLEVEMHNMETSLEPGCSEPCLKSASHVQTCLGNKDGSNSMNVGDVGLGRETSSILRDVDEEAVDDVEHEADQQVQVLLDSNNNGSVSTDNELDEETTSTQVQDQDSNEGCVKKALSKKRSLKMKGYDDNNHVKKKRPFSCKVDGCGAKFGSKTELDRHVDEVHLKKRPFACKEVGCQAKFGSKKSMNRHVDAVHLKKRPFSCKEDGCQARFGSKGNMNTHVDTVHLKKRPFKCSNCPKDFGVKASLLTHIKQVHQKEKAFLCQELGCEKRFARKMMLKGHMRSAHGAPKLVCKKAECSATFVWVTNLYHHMKQDH